jgi:hypothetical protein
MVLASNYNFIYNVNLSFSDFSKMRLRVVGNL